MDILALVGASVGLDTAQRAGITPPVIVTDVEPKLAVHRSNSQNRDATPGQKAMATAMAFPEATDKGGRGKKGKTVDSVNGFDRAYLSRARYILRNTPTAEGQRFPQRCLDIMAGLVTLTEAYTLTQEDVKRREEEEAIRQTNAVKLADLRNRYPNLAALVFARRRRTHLMPGSSLNGALSRILPLAGHSYYTGNSRLLPLSAVNVINTSVC